MSTSSSSSGARIDPHETFVKSIVGSRIAGRYIVERLLGKGGMGIVVVARYPELDQDVAIKIMFPEHAANGVLAARFMREARVAAKVKSPHLVRVSDVGRLESDVPYLVMELLAGHDLDHEIAERGPLPPEDAVELMLQAMTGIAELHALGIVHRDLKPSNLFLTEVHGERAIKVLDFGISKDAGGTGGGLTVTDSLIGTPSHMSPEQIKTPKEVDPRADIWSLGVILYELVTRRMPFDLEGESVGELFGHILFSEPIPPRSRNGAVPAGLEEVILKCLRRERTERWADVGELAEALRPWAAPSAVHRVEAIKKALAARRSAPAQSDPKIAVASSDPSPPPVANEKATVASGKPPRIEQRGDVVVPADQDAVSAAVLGETAVADNPRERERAVSSKSLATSPVTLDEQDRSRRPKTWLLAAVAVLGLAIGGVVVVALASNGTRKTIGGDTTPSAAPSSEPSANANGLVAPPPPSEISTAIVVPTVAPSARPSSSPRPAVAAPVVRPVVRPAAPPTASAPAPAKTGGELILDRK